MHALRDASLQKAKSFARRVHGPLVARRQREHAFEIRARLGGVGQLHVEDAAIDEHDLIAGIEPDRLVVVGERAVVLAHVAKRTGAIAVGHRISRLQPDALVEIGNGATIITLLAPGGCTNEVGLSKEGMILVTSSSSRMALSVSSFFRRTMARQ